MDKLFMVKISVSQDDTWIIVKDLCVDNITDKKIFHSGDQELQKSDLNKILSRFADVYTGNLDYHMFVTSEEDATNAEKELTEHVEKKLDGYEKKISNNRGALKQIVRKHQKLD